MKTIVFLLLLIPFNICAKTETYYSPYSEFSNFSDKMIENNDMVDVQKEKFYKCYREEYSYDYYIMGENKDEHPYLDNIDFIFTNFSEWSSTLPIVKPERKIEKRNAYYYQDVKKIKYFHFTNLKGSFGKLNINEIIIYNKTTNQKISYKTECDNCNSSFSKHISDGNFYQVDSYILNDGYLRLELDDYYDLNDLKIIFYLTDLGTHEKAYEISTSRDGNINSNIYSSVYTRHWFTHQFNDELKKVEYDVIDFLFENPERTEEKVSLVPIYPSKTRLVFTREEYRYQDKLYKYYSNSKLYSDDYYNEPQEKYPFIDYNLVKELYRYRSRDKFEIKKDIIIKDKSTKLEDFVIYNSSPFLNISSDLNISKNGNYIAHYKLPYITVIKNVIVDIEENKLNSKIAIENNISKKLVNNKVNLVTMDTTKDTEEKTIPFKKNIQEKSSLNFYQLNNKPKMPIKINKKPFITISFILFLLLFLLLKIRHKKLSN